MFTVNASAYVMLLGLLPGYVSAQESAPKPVLVAFLLAAAGDQEEMRFPLRADCPPVSEEACAPGFSAIYVMQPEKFLLLACCTQEDSEPVARPQG